MRLPAPAAAVLSAWLSIGSALPAQVIDQVLVNVNGDIITRRQLDERVRSVLAQQQGRAIAVADIGASEALRQQAEALRPRVVSDTIDELLVLQRARELGFGVGEDDVDRVIARIRLDNNIGSDAEFAELLRGQGIPPDALRESLRNQIRIEQVRQDVFRRVSVAEAEAEAYYRARPEEFTAKPGIVFREILVALPPLEETRGSPATAQEYDRGLIRFVKARDRVSKGEDFAEVARTASDAPSKDTGGMVGPIDPQTLPEALRPALAKLAGGEVSAPVRTDQGYWLLKLESISEPRPVTFEALRDRVIGELLASKQAAAFAAQLKRLRAQAVIVWKDQALKAAYEALPTGRRFPGTARPGDVACHRWHRSVPGVARRTGHG
jgi:peptidyl-prolyl cis-trans isomerase SurA